MKLEDQVKALQAIVEKQSQLIAKTGQQLIEIQVQSVKAKMKAEESPSLPKGIDMDDYVTNEDIVQLVGELQGQLDFLEDRSIKRTFNTVLAESDKTAVIAPLSNRDGDEPPSDVFPATVADFLTLGATPVVVLCEFYELIVENVDESAGAPPQPKSLEERVREFTKEQISEFKDELARYLGLRFRETAGVW